MFSKGSQPNIFSSVTTSNLAILASLKRQGLPLVDLDDLQTQLTPTKSISQTESPLKLPLENLVRTPSLPSIQLTNRQQKKKAVAFVDTDVILETPKNKPNPPNAERSPTSQVQKGILIKKRKYSDHGDETKELVGIENNKEQNLKNAAIDENNVEEVQKSEKPEKLTRNPPSFLDLVKDNSKIQKSIFSRPHRVKKSLTDEFPDGSATDQTYKEERLADNLRKNFNLGLSKEDMTIKKSLSSFLSPRINIKSEAISLFKGSHNTELLSPLKLKKPNDPPILNSQSPRLAKNNSKIPSFNVGNASETSRNEQNSPRLLMNGPVQSQEIKLKKIESEDKYTVIDNPFENFQKKHIKNNSGGYDLRNQFALSAANNILKADNRRVDNRISLLPKLEIFNEYRRSLPGSYNNTPRKY